MRQALRHKIQKDKGKRVHTCHFVKMGVRKKEMLGYDTDLDVRECNICGFRYIKQNM